MSGRRGRRPGRRRPGTPRRSPLGRAAPEAAGPAPSPRRPPPYLGASGPRRRRGRREGRGGSMGPGPRGAGRPPRRLPSLLLLLVVARGATRARGADGECGRRGRRSGGWRWRWGTRAGGGDRGSGWASGRLGAPQAHFPAPGPDPRRLGRGAQVGLPWPLGIGKAGLKEAGGAPRPGLPAPSQSRRTDLFGGGLARAPGLGGRCGFAVTLLALQ